MHVAAKLAFKTGIVKLCTVNCRTLKVTGREEKTPRMFA